MKKLIALFLSVALISCGGAETKTEKTPEEIEKERQMDEINAQLKFGMSKAEYETFKTHTLTNISKLKEDGAGLFEVWYSDERIDMIRKSRESATEQFQSIIDDNPITIYTDSAEIYLDSIDYY